MKSVCLAQRVRGSVHNTQSHHQRKVDDMGKSKPIFRIKIYCTCNQLLYDYDKEGPGGLIKCFVDRIVVDYTKGDCKCPKCGQEFARVSKIRARPIHKIIHGHVYKRGNCGD